jgi:hypothetical protein
MKHGGKLSEEPLLFQFQTGLELQCCIGVLVFFSVVNDFVQDAIGYPLKQFLFGRYGHAAKVDFRKMPETFNNRHIT